MAAGTSYFCPIGQLLKGRLGFNNFISFCSAILTAVGRTTGALCGVRRLLSALGHTDKSIFGPLLTNPFLIFAAHSPAGMAAQLAEELEKQLSKIDHNADDPAVLLEAFITVSECVATYLTVSRQATQSQEVRDSRTKILLDLGGVAPIPAAQVSACRSKGSRALPSSQRPCFVDRRPVH